MPIRISHPSCLKPRLLGRKSAGAVRIEGILSRRGGDETLLVDAIDFDGDRCRYRSPEHGEHWVTEQADDEFKSCAQTIVDRLRVSEHDDGAPLSIVDSAITEAGALMIAVRNDAGGDCRWLPLSA